MLALAWRRFGLAASVAAAVLVSDVTATGLKAVIHVDRPPTRYPEPKPLVHVPLDHSFPSGHAATSFAGATMLTAAVPKAAPLWFLLAAAIAFSRVYVGVHYPLDVLGGAVLGAAIATALLLLARALRRSRAATRPG